MRAHTHTRTYSWKFFAGTGCGGTSPRLGDGNIEASGAGPGAEAADQPNPVVGDVDEDMNKLGDKGARG